MVRQGLRYAEARLVDAMGDRVDLVAEEVEHDDRDAGMVMPKAVLIGASEIPVESWLASGYGLGQRAERADRPQHRSDQAQQGADAGAGALSPGLLSMGSSRAVASSRSCFTAASRVSLSWLASCSTSCSPGRCAALFATLPRWASHSAMASSTWSLPMHVAHFLDEGIDRPLPLALLGDEAFHREDQDDRFTPIRMGTMKPPL
jgi:hypothetical protein